MSDFGRRLGTVAPVGCREVGTDLYAAGAGHYAGEGGVDAAAVQLQDSLRMKGRPAGTAVAADMPDARLDAPSKSEKVPHSRLQAGRSMERPGLGTLGIAAVCSLRTVPLTRSGIAYCVPALVCDLCVWDCLFWMNSRPALTEVLTEVASLQLARVQHQSLLRMLKMVDAAR